MALFNRNKTDSVMPEEVRDYYKSEQRTRTGKAWILAIVTLLVTFLVAAALFFGGRWVYRAIFDDDSADTTSQTESEGSTEQAASPTDNQPPTDDSNTSSTSTDADNGSAPAAATPTSPTPTPASTTPSAAMPNSGPSELVNTGPGDE